ncbi:Retrovirus-related Pol polyprotein from transposon TNT 1-94 [Sesamum angolense]|uniref:Retrovirus-related Pol polyprotein from transposon TNT 1-94 n=1 Tax=Sesamum angolense TaxID=2727404 RepID=A0AAE1X0W3_9LAMI|nr:Retrovirus-related Pol polyprotein from transposon TNT 1-94 [Sesamum angolense]
MTVQNKCKLENLENAQIWHARLGHITQDRMKRLVDSKSLEIDNLDNLPAYVCGPLNTQARGGFSYFITFTNDHSQYGYVYLMRYKSKAFVRFKEFRLEVENQTGRKIKALRSNRGGEYLSGEFIDSLKKNGYALETAARLLNIAPSKTVAQTPYQIWHGKPASYKYLRVRVALLFFERGFPTDTRHDELLLVESSEAPQSNAGTSSAPDVSTDNVLILRRSARVPQPPERYGFFGVTSQLDNDPKTYGEAMSDIDSGKWLEAMKFEMDSMSSNQVWTLVDRPKAVTPVGCKESINMDVKTAFLNDFVEEEIYMDQPKGFTVVVEEQKSYGAMISLKMTLTPVYTRRYQACAGEAQWTAVKTILKYLRRTKDVFLVYGGGELILERFINASFQSDDDDAKSQSGFVFKLNGGVVVWKNCKEMVGRGDVRMDRVSSAENTTDQLTKPLSQIGHAQHLGKMGLRQMSDWL